MSQPQPVRIEFLLGTHLAVSPRIHGDLIYFLSDLGGHLSLYRMRLRGGEPELLLPPEIALQNPAQMMGASPFFIMPDAGRIMVAIDRSGDERYQPHLLSLAGGSPEPVFPGESPAERLLPLGINPQGTVAYFHASDQRRDNHEILAIDLRTQAIELLARRRSLAYWVTASADGSVAITSDLHSWGDDVLYLTERASGQRRLLAGRPPESRDPSYRKLSVRKPHILPSNGAALLAGNIYTDTYSPCLLSLEGHSFAEVRVCGLSHAGRGELQRLDPVSEDLYFLEYNIDGCSHGYIGTLDANRLELRILHKIMGESDLAGGVLHSISFARLEGGAPQAAFSFSTATSPVQIYHVDLAAGPAPRLLTRERITGIDLAELSPGEDASYNSFDGLRISARLYLPSPRLGHKGKRPLILWIHGGPQSQERPDFSWFSMPLIQYLTLNGFAVFVPNVRGSSGYGIDYMSRVHKDWGGQDLKDHLSGLKHLEGDQRIDSTRRGVAGRSYGGFMTMCLMSRHPGVFRAGVNLFGLCDLIGFIDGMPEHVRGFIRRNVGDPSIEEERRRLVECSPTTHFHRIEGPVLFIQGTSDPRTRSNLTLQYADTLRGMGKDVEVLSFEDEGHDVIKPANRAICYQRMTDFFRRHVSGA